MKIKKLPVIFSVITIAILFTVYYTSVGYTTELSNSAKIVKSADSISTNPVYTCPMHPDVVSDKPGKCPKCGMDLVLKSDDNSSDNKMTMKDCMDKCKEKGCNMDNCKGESGSCKDGCANMKDCKNKEMNNGKCKSDCMGH